MDLLQICEPLFQYVCRLNRLGRKGGEINVGLVRTEIRRLFAEMRQRAEASAGMEGPYDCIEKVLMYFVDSVILNSRLKFSPPWKPFSADPLQLGINEAPNLRFEETFWDILDGTLRDPSDQGTQCLSVFYQCVGLGFMGLFADQPEHRRLKMLEISARLGKMVDEDVAGRICPEAYDNVDMRDMRALHRLGLDYHLMGLMIRLIAAPALYIVDSISTVLHGRKIVIGAGRRDVKKAFLGLVVIVCIGSAFLIATDFTSRAPTLNTIAGCVVIVFGGLVGSRTLRYQQASLTGSMIGAFMGGLIALAVNLGGRPAAIIAVTVAFAGGLAASVFSTLRIRRRIGRCGECGRWWNLHSPSPTTALDPASKARMDDLCKNFDDGVERLRKAGKDLHILPWFLLVGPSGSGKTEALRHIGFPPRFQEWGAGGNLKVHWWLFNQAVVFDTMGRMFMVDSAAGRAEWQEFLRPFKSSRPDCPINGMLLVISAENLLQDSAEKIAATAGIIARHLDLTQRTLNVRFPVTVLVTKCDKIVGFSEFFETLTDPIMKHQMLGWSNPSGLDEALKPEMVERHIADLRSKLMRRRMVLLQDPVHTQNPSARRIDQVDELFEFPENLTRIAPHLRSYIEKIFVGGEWSPKPLFLRGIYFTSSMRQGEALDVSLAQALGVGVESLPGSREWDMYSAYFIRDVFLSKVFREKGLVIPSVGGNGAGDWSPLEQLAGAVVAIGTIVIAVWILVAG